MNPNDPGQRVFFEVHCDLPREAPGSRACTLAALERVLAALDTAPPARVLDVGCGPGTQTLDLAAALPQADILALDLHEPFLRGLAARSIEAGTDGRITPVRADMRHLPVAAGTLDLVWCEGAAYIMGVGPSLDAWRRLLRPNGACAFTEAVWLRPDPPAPVAAFWQEYPGMDDVGACRMLIRERGFELLDDFVLPSSAWWDDYYHPMGARLTRLEARYRDDTAALAVLAECRREIETYRRFGDWYGYACFVARRL